MVAVWSARNEPQPARPEGETIVLPSGQRIGFARFGMPGGSPVLAFHGAPACRLMYAGADEPAKRLGLEIIAPDRPGYGLTPADAAPTLAGRTDQHVALVDALGLNRFSIIGVSGGSPYAVALAARLGSRVTNLALISPMGPIAECLALPPQQRPRVALGHRIFFQRWPLRRRRLFHAAMRFGYRGLMAAPERITGLIVRIFDAADRRLLTQPKVAEGFVAMTLESLKHGPDGGLVDLDIFAKPWGVDYAAISARTVLWQGTKDQVVPMGVAFRLARMLPGCRLIRVEGAGHFWVLGRIREVLTELARDIAITGSKPG